MSFDLTVFADLNTLTLTDYLFRFALALAVGAFIGTERERSNSSSKAPGVRTFALLSLTGAAAVLFGPIVLAVTVLAAVAVALSPFFQPRIKNDEPVGFGATTVATALLAPLLGALAVLTPALAAAAAVAIVVILTSKHRLHAFIEETVTPTEIADAVKFFVIALIILPLLPDKTIDPFETINPHKIGLLVVALTGISWIGYIAVRAFGARRGLPLAGLAGGLVSSTATTASMVRRARQTTLRRPAIAAALLSKVSSLATLAIVVAVVSMKVIPYLIAPVAVMIVVLLATARIYGRPRKPKAEELDGTPETTPEVAADPSSEAESTQDVDERLDIGRPFALKPALILAGIITFALFASKAAAQFLGPQAVLAVAALTGTADTQASAVASAALVNAGTITPAFAVLAIMAAIVTNTMLKIVLAYSAGGRTAGNIVLATLTPATLAMLATGGIVFLVAPHL